MSDAAFADLFSRVRAGDQTAIAELVQRYEAEIRGYIRSRMRAHPYLRRVMDSQDICQSAMREFFREEALARFELDSSLDLVKLLQTIARNNLQRKAEAARAGKRRQERQVEAESGQLEAVAGREPTPSQEVSLQELLVKFRERLSPFEGFLAEQRRVGTAWNSFAEDVGGGATGEGLRKRAERAIARVVVELGLTETEP